MSRPLFRLNSVATSPGWKQFAVTPVPSRRRASSVVNRMLARSKRENRRSAIDCFLTRAGCSLGDELLGKNGAQTQGLVRRGIAARAEVPREMHSRKTGPGGTASPCEQVEELNTPLLVYAGARQSMHVGAEGPMHARFRFFGLSQTWHHPARAHSLSAELGHQS
jgi:hypothetical protein